MMVPLDLRSLVTLLSLHDMQRGKSLGWIEPNFCLLAVSLIQSSGARVSCVVGETPSGDLTYSLKNN